MIASRTALILKQARLLRANNSAQFQQKVRNGHHHWNYRVAAPPAPKRVLYVAEFTAAFTWWWVVWHLLTEPGHVFGEFEYPNASEWTDEELGIPPLHE